MFGQQTRERGTGCPKPSPREAKYSRSWAASAEKRCWLPKTKSAGSQILEKLGSKRGEEVLAAQKSSPREAQILEKLGSKRGEEVLAAQKQVRGKSNTREVGQQARRRGAGCPKASSREAKYIEKLGSKRGEEVPAAQNTICSRECSIT